MSTLNSIRNTIMVSLTIIVFACTKAKVIQPFVPLPPEKTKFEVIPGKYKIYDSLGNYLYDMNITYWGEKMPDGSRRDTFQFENFDNQYTLKYRQSLSSASNRPKYDFHLGSYDGIKDSLNHRTFLFSFDCHFSNDSLYLHYEFNNIKYWMEDSCPYEHVSERRIGIKQK